MTTLKQISDDNDLTFIGLPFPHNICALLFSWEAGIATDFHSAYFDCGEKSLVSAQQRLLSLLSSRLRPEMKVLVTGSGVGHLTEMLQSAGHDVTCIADDAAQLTCVQNLYGSDLPIEKTRLQDFYRDAGEWDLLVLLHNSSNLAQLDLLGKASHLLRPDGGILVLDDFDCRRTGSGSSTAHMKKYFLAMAERFGFSPVYEQDCSKNILPILDFFGQSVEKNKSKLKRYTGCSSVVLDELMQNNKIAQRKYLDGERGCFLLHLRREKKKPWELRYITEDNQPEVSELYARVFEQKMSPAFWRWKYGPGRGQAIGLWQNQQLIAHYGGMSRTFVHRGDNALFSQSCDVMVAPEVRAVMMRRGPFFLVCSTFVEHYIGYGTPHIAAYGFPNERANRLPHKLGIYSKPMTQVSEASWSAAENKTLWLKMRIIDPESSRDASMVELLWQRMRNDLDHLYLGVRDAKWWRERYTRHPQFDYRIFLLEKCIGKKPVAVFAVKVEGSRLELIDWVAPVANFAKLIAAARHIAAQEGFSDVYSWVSSPVVPWIEKTAPKYTNLAISVPGNSWTEGPDSTIFREKLWLTGGDTDFH